MFRSILFLGLCSTIIASCKKDDLQEAEFGRRFSPGTVQSSAGQTQLKLEWNPSLYADTNVTYLVELSKTPDFATIDYSVTVDTAGAVITDQHIQIRTPYYVRIRANGNDKIEASKWIVSAEPVQISGAQIIQPITSEDLTARTVKLKWTAPGAVTHLMIGSTRYDISPAEASVGEKTISGLLPETEYTVVIYNNALERGTRTFTTLADLPQGPNVIVVAPTDNLASMIANATNGTTFVLLRGSKYTSDTEIVIPNGVSFTIWGQGGGSKPVLAFNGLKLPATAGTIKFEGVDITGYENDAGVVKRAYLFNQSVPTATSQIIFENCVVRNFANTPLRIQNSNPAGTVVIDNFIANNCIVHDIGDNGTNGTYAFVHVNSTTVGSKVNNITITNSTFSKIGYSLVIHNTSPSLSLTIENNTFYNVIGNGRYLIDYNAQTISAFTFKNNIIGKTLSPANSARGVRYSGGNISSSNNYKTSDAIISANPIPNVTDYNKTSSEVFTAPDSGNFLIKDSTFPGRADAGDPRWRP